MKKMTRRSFTAAGILATLGLAGFSLKGCDPFNPFNNEPVAVYGPPEMFDPDSNENQDVYGPAPDYDPSENEVVTVYGPPEDFEPIEAPNDAESDTAE